MLAIVPCVPSATVSCVLYVLCVPFLRRSFARKALPEGKTTEDTDHTEKNTTEDAVSF